MSDLIKALKNLLHREWGETDETEFILEAVEEYLQIHDVGEKKEHENKVKSAMEVFDSFIGEITK